MTATGRGTTAEMKSPYRAPPERVLGFRDTHGLWDASVEEWLDLTVSAATSPFLGRTTAAKPFARWESVSGRNQRLFHFPFQTIMGTVSK